jgi:hypothetical protein
LAGNDAEGVAVAEGGALFAIAQGAAAQLDVRLRNSTLSGNTAHADEAASGGAVVGHAEGTGAEPRVHVSSCTVTDNTASGVTSSAGGLGAVGPAATFELRNSIVWGNHATSEADCSAGTGALLSAGHGLFGACALVGGTEDLFDLDPLLGVLGLGGGPTPIHMPSSTSPVLDAGNPSGCTDEDGLLLEVDQRGEPRTVGQACDIGAIELDL